MITTTFVADLNEIDLVVATLEIEHLATIIMINGHYITYTI